MRNKIVTFHYEDVNKLHEDIEAFAWKHQVDVQNFPCEENKEEGKRKFEIIDRMPFYTERILSFLEDMQKEGYLKEE
jgi:hypothetical protein